MPVYEDLTGKRFGTLLVIARVKNRSGRIHWRCRCDCGREFLIRSNGVKRGSCGCQQRRGTHQQSRSRTYRIWIGMHQRCYNENTTHYADYGGRGIGFDDPRWFKFEAFFADMGECPPKLTIERRDNNRGYCKDNCYWGTRKQQAVNRRGRKLEMADVHAIRADSRAQAIIASEFNISQAVVSAIKRGKTWAHVR